MAELAVPRGMGMMSPLRYDDRKDSLIVGGRFSEHSCCVT